GPDGRWSDSTVSRPRRTVARNATSPRSFSAWASRLAKVPDAIPGAAPPTTATALRRRPAVAKIPSTVFPPDTAAANATSPASLSAGIGCRPNPENAPPPGAASPSAAIESIRVPVARKKPSLARPRRSVAKNATCPRELTGATTGRASMLNRSNAPPPGAAWPATATRWGVGDEVTCTAGLTEGDCRRRCAEELCDNWFWLDRRPCWNWGYGG